MQTAHAAYLNSRGTVERQKVLKEVMVCLRGERREMVTVREVISRENRREHKGESTKGWDFQSQKGAE